MEKHMFTHTHPYETMGENNGIGIRHLLKKNGNNSCIFVGAARKYVQ